MKKTISHRERILDNNDDGDTMAGTEFFIRTLPRSLLHRSKILIKVEREERSFVRVILRVCPMARAHWRIARGEWKRH